MDVTKEYVVDLWKTGAHKVEIGIKKEDVLRAKSRQYTKDFDIIGEVNRDGKDAGYVGFRTDPWKAEIPKKKIVIKFFTEGISWKGSLEELISRGITNSLSANQGLPVFMINLSTADYLIVMEKVIRRKFLEKSIFSFALVDEKTLVSHSFSIVADRFSIGSDWDVFNQRQEKIAEIDGSKFNIGGKFKIKINAKAVGYSNELDQVLILFSTLTRYINDVEDKLEDTLKMIKKDDAEIVIDQEEANLYLNPRRMKI